MYDPDEKYNCTVNSMKIKEQRIEIQHRIPFQKAITSISGKEKKINFTPNARQTPNEEIISPLHTIYDAGEKFTKKP
jgi:hypothetical protein